MGYNTEYSMEISVVAKPEEAMKQLLEEVEDAKYSFNEDGSSRQTISSWGERDKQLREFSKKHPGLVFKVSCEGEDAGDLWDEYYVNGKMQRCDAKMQKAPFDPKKLE